MLTTYINTVRAVVRTPSAIVWTLLFPIVLATVFNFMFEPLRAGRLMSPVRVAVVEDEQWEREPFSQVVEALGRADEDEGEDEGRQLLEVTAVASETRAHELLAEGTVDGAYLVDAEGEPHVLLAPPDSPAHAAENLAAYQTNRQIIENVAASYTANRALMVDAAGRASGMSTVIDAIEEGPAAAANGASAAIGSNDPAGDAVQTGVTGETAATSASQISLREVSLTHAQPDTGARFYYALLGMAVMFAAQLSCEQAGRLVPVISDVAARRSIAGMSRLRQLVPTLAGCWTVSTVFLSAVLAYICLTGGIDFVGREALCLLGIGMSTLLACCLGAFVGSLPLKSNADSRSGILTAFTCLLSLFAGLYGEPTMELADAIARAFPAAMWVNPVSLVRDVFYSLYYYDALLPFALRLAACLAFAGAFFAGTAALIRRERYEHL